MRSTLLLNAGTPQEQNRPLVGGAVIDNGRADLASLRRAAAASAPPPSGIRGWSRADVAYGYVSAAAAQELYGRTHQPTSDER